MNSWSPNSEEPSTQEVVDSLFVGPKGQKSQLVVIGSMSTASGAHMMSHCHYKKGKQWLPTPLLVLEACGLLPRAIPC